MTRTYLFSRTAALVIILSTQSVVAQTNITITSIDDALLYNNTHSSQSQSRDANYGAHIRISALAWTYSGSPSYFRNMIRFDLSAVPDGAVIQSAVFYLYSDPTITSGSNSNSGSNAFYLEKVTQNWAENTVTWNNQPPTTTVGRVWTGPSSSATENRQVDITSLVQQWIDTPSSNFGLKMILENEVYYRSRNYASSEHSNAAIRPKLEVTYTSATPAIYWPVNDGNWSDAIWSQDINASIGELLPEESVVNVAGHIITLRTTATVKDIRISARNSEPGVLIVDGGRLQNKGELEVETDNTGNEIRIINGAELIVMPED